MIHFHIVTLFPDAIDAYLSSSILGRAREKKLLKISYYDPKKYAVGKHPIRKASPSNGAGKRYLHIDGRPYGGGPGMVMLPEPILRAADKVLKNKKGVEKIFFTTDGAQFNEAMAKKLSRKKDILLISGRYEGVDARVPKILKAKPVTVGPFVLTGGELPAATVVDAIARFIPGVLGKIESLERSRVSSPEVYTRPETLVWKGKKYRVPKVLLTGHHANIDKWKRGM